MDPSCRCFRFRLRSLHDAPSGATRSLDLAMRHSDSGDWLPQTPDLTTPRFRLFLLSLLLCQHFHLVRGAEAHGLPLEQVEGEMAVVTAADWLVQEVHGSFALRLRPGDGAAAFSAAAGSDPAALQRALDDLRERLAHCPVARNLPPGAATSLALNVVV